MENINIPGYRIIEPLGRGGMSSVYLAVQEIFGRHVALKVLSRELAESEQFGLRFLREARLVASFNHPNIITVYDTGCIDGMYYLAMEYLSGGDLRKKLSEGVSIAEALGIIIAAADAIDYASCKGVVHRDIKPTNIMLREDCSLALVDFGIAYDINCETMVTAVGTVLGTPQYMSPEQSLGEATDHRSDIYSLGIVFYELLVGKVPFSADSAAGIGLKHISATVPPLPEHLFLFQPILNRMLEKAPTDRYQDVTELVDDLERLADILPVEMKSTILLRQDQDTPGNSISSKAARSFNYLRRRSLRTNSQIPSRKRRTRRGLWLAVTGGVVLASCALLLITQFTREAPAVANSVPRSLPPLADPIANNATDSTAAEVAILYPESEAAGIDIVDVQPRLDDVPANPIEVPEGPDLSESLTNFHERIMSGNLRNAAQDSAYHDLQQLRQNLGGSEFERAMDALNRAAGLRVDSLLKAGSLQEAERHIDDWEVAVGSATPRDYRVRLIRQQQDLLEQTRHLSALKERVSALTEGATRDPATNKELILASAELAKLEPEHSTVATELNGAVMRELDHAEAALARGDVESVRASLDLLNRVVPENGRLAEIEARATKLEQDKDKVTSAIYFAEQVLENIRESELSTSLAPDGGLVQIQRIANALAELTNAERIKPYGQLTMATKTELLTAYQKFFRACVDSGDLESARIYVRELERVGGQSIAEQTMLVSMREQLKTMAPYRRKDLPSF